MLASGTDRYAQIGWYGMAMVTLMATTTHENIQSDEN
jgi:hypothetical protein